MVGLHLAEFRQWSSLKAEGWDCVNHTLGEIEQVRHLASLPASVLKHAMGATRIPVPGAPDPRPLTAAEMLMLGLFWRACRKAVGLADVDPLTDTAAAPAEVTPASPTKANKRVKTRSELDRAYAYHVEVTGAEPTHEAEPTAEQLAALTDKIVKRGEAPYADFSIFTPYTGDGSNDRCALDPMSSSRTEASKPQRSQDRRPSRLGRRAGECSRPPCT